MLFLGIDLGTSSIKLVVMDEKGEIKASAGGEYGLSFPKPGCIMAAASVVAYTIAEGLADSSTSVIEIENKEE